MNIPAIKGMIDRRILVNFTVDPEIISRILPAPFKPKIFEGKAIVGVCLIRLKNIRPKGFPSFISLSSENGAHRIAVEWFDSGKKQEGVFIPRRDTSSRINSFVGGKLFPGQHYHAQFTVTEDSGRYDIGFKSSDSTTIEIKSKKTSEFNPASIFKTLENASQFFQRGALGFSPNGNSFDGLELRTIHWKVEPLSVSKVQSSFFENRNIFPEGSVQFDNALLMTEVEHEWHSVAFTCR